jgi:Flp pilus assembly protein TadB
MAAAVCCAEPGLCLGYLAPGRGAAMNAAGAIVRRGRSPSWAWCSTVLVAHIAGSPWSPPVFVLAVVISALLAQLLVVRPRLTRRSDAVLAGRGRLAGIRGKDGSR